MPFSFIVGGDDLPVAKRERKVSWSDEEVAGARAGLEAIARLGRHESYAAARAAHAVLTDGQPYAEKGKASSAAARVVSLLRYIVGPDWAEATFHQQIGKRSDGGYGWAVYMGPYEAPKPRQRKPAETAPAAPAAPAPAKGK